MRISSVMYLGGKKDNIAHISHVIVVFLSYMLRSDILFVEFETIFIPCLKYPPNGTV